MFHCNGWCFPDLDIAILVHDARIAGVEPAAGEYFLRRLGVLEIPLHHDVAADEDLADGLAVARHWLQLKQSLGNPEKKKGAAIMPPLARMKTGDLSHEQRRETSLEAAGMGEVACAFI
jgi:hypothetical protein